MVMIFDVEVKNSEIPKSESIKGSNATNLSDISQFKGSFNHDAKRFLICKFILFLAIGVTFLLVI